MKKKLFSIALALVVLLGLSGTVSAATVRFFDEQGGTRIGQENTTPNSSTVSIEEPTRENFIFEGWATDGWYTIGLNGRPTPVQSNGVTINGNSVTVSRNVPGYALVDVYATWTEVYTITYELDGGEAEGNPTSYTSDETVVIADPTKEGYEFLGWLDEEGQELGKNLQLEEGSEGDRTFTATWEKNPEPEQVVEADEDQPAETKNPNTGINTTLYTVLLMLGLTSFIGLNVVSKKNN